MAATLLAAGEPKKRLALPNSRILIHQPHMGGLSGQATDIDIHAREILRIREITNNNFSSIDLKKDTSNIATLPGYNFSEALKHLDIVWTPDTVAKLFEIGPANYTPGTKMPEQRIGAPEDRDELRLGEAPRADREQRLELEVLQPGRWVPAPVK